MSYDVSFRPAPGAFVPTIAALDDYFRGRPGYTVDGGRAQYENDATGVAFRFAYDDEQRGWGDVGPIGLTAPIQAPAPRALELADEVEALVREFDLLVDDPTIQGMGSGELDRDALVRGCLAASRFGYVVDIGMQRLTAQTVRVYDDARLEACWRWNRAHGEMSEGTIFVPRITFVAHGRNAVLATVAWLGDAPVLLPEVDAITTLDTSGAEAWMKVIPIAAIAPLVDPLYVNPSPSRHRRLDPSPELTAAMREAKPMAKAPTTVPFPDVLGERFWAQTLQDYEAWSGGKTIVVADDVPKAKRKPAAKAKAKPAAKAKAKPAAKAKAKPAAKAKAKAKPAAKAKAKPAAKAKAKPAAKAKAKPKKR